jgi:glycosyltransferase involved in cell wall biosynthesis
MKILHVVTLHSADNAFGGPVRVSINLATELRAQGNSVVILAGSRGLPQTDIIEGVPCKLFPVRSIHAKLGFSGMYSWKLLAWTWNNIKDFDVVHLHLARDLITLPVGLIAMLRGTPFVIQGHGMIDPTSKFLGRILDGLATKRLLRQASRILFLTPTEDSDIKEVSRNRNAEMSFVPNGVPESDVDGTKDPKYVSFISRLQDRKNPKLFVQMASILGNVDQRYEFRIAGADEGRLADTLVAIRDTTLGTRIAYLGALDHGGVLELLNETKILVLPSVNEPFPMIILEALSKSVPVVITETCGLAPYILDSGAGMVVIDGSPTALATSVRHILDDYSTFSASASKLANDSFSMTSVTKKLMDIYDECDRTRHRPLT